MMYALITENDTSRYGAEPQWDVESGFNSREAVMKEIQARLRDDVEMKARQRYRIVEIMDDVQVLEEDFLKDREGYADGEYEEERASAVQRIVQR